MRYFPACTLIRAGRVAAPGALALLLIAGCAGPNGSGGTYGSSGSKNDSSPSAGASNSIKTNKGDLGTYLTDQSGRTVYMFASDSPGKSTCDGACATAWPPLTTDDVATASGGAKSNQLSTITRSDGQTQLAYGGHPLYYFVNDAQAGDVNGQGNNGFNAKWWVVAPSGEPITKAKASATPEQPGDGGY